MCAGLIERSGERPVTGGGPLNRASPLAWGVCRARVKEALGMG